MKVLKVDNQNGIILVKGAVPGHKDSVLKIFDSIKKNQEIKPINKSEGHEAKDSTQQQPKNDSSNLPNESEANAPENKGEPEQNKIYQNKKHLIKQTNQLRIILRKR